MRIVRIVVKGDLLQHLMTNGRDRRGFKIEEGLPNGARCTGSTWDAQTGYACLVFEHESFDEHLGPADSAPLVTPHISPLEPDVAAVGDGDVHAICEANSDAYAAMLNEARDNARTLSDALKQCCAAFADIKAAANTPGVGLPANVAASIRAAWTGGRRALTADNEIRKAGGW